MPIFRITVLNQTFLASSNHELASADAAQEEGIRSALGIGSDEVIAGKEFFGAEVKIEGEDELVRRFVVSVGASSLQ